MGLKFLDAVGKGAGVGIFRKPRKTLSSAAIAARKYTMIHITDEKVGSNL